MEKDKILRNISPPHILIDGFQREAEVKARHNKPFYALTTEVGIDGFKEIQKIRFATLGKLAMVSSGAMVVVALAESVI